MARCFYDEYRSAHEQARAALLRADAEALETARAQLLRSSRPNPALRLGLEDAMCGRPARGRIHVCRMHLFSWCLRGCRGAPADREGHVERGSPSTPPGVGPA